MHNRLLLYLVILSSLVLSGCFIKGRVVDENGKGVAGVTVTLSGAASGVCTTNRLGDYQFGSFSDKLPAGSYTITPSGNTTPASKDVTLTLRNSGVANPVTKVDFMVLSSEILTEEEKGFLTAEELSEINKLDLGELINRGLINLGNQEVFKSKVYFKIADFLGEGTTSNDADEARFFYALTRIASLALDNQADDYDEGLQDAGDVLDAFGVSESGRDLLGETNMIIPDPLPASSPTGGEIQDFLVDVVIAEFEGALENLDAISSSFNTTWAEPVGNTSVESDYGDVFVIKAALKTAIAGLLIQYAYNLDADIASAEFFTKENILSNNPNILRLRSTIYLDEARNYLIEATGDAGNSIDFILAETDSQIDDFVNLASATSEEISNAREIISLVIQGLNGSTTTIDTGIINNTTDDTIVDISPFFSGIDLRALLPLFVGDEPDGFLPDTSLGGVLLQLKGENPNTLNADINENNRADIFEDVPNISFLYHYYGTTYIYWDGLDGASEYHVYYSTTPGVGYSSQMLPPIPPATVGMNYCSHSNLQEGVTYYYRIAAVTSFGETLLSEEKNVYVPMPPTSKVSLYPSTGSKSAGTTISEPGYKFTPNSTESLHLIDPNRIHYSPSSNPDLRKNTNSSVYYCHSYTVHSGTAEGV